MKVRALLADLLVHRGRPVSVDRLIDDLWRDELPVNPTGALQTKVSQLRRVLEEAEPGCRDLVVSRPPGYLLRVDAEALDMDRFAALAARAGASGDPRARAALLSDALALWRGPAFADFGDEEFTRPAIQRLEEQRLLALEEQAQARLELGEHSVLVGELRELVAQYPLRERLRAAQLRSLYGAGRQSEALAGYGELRDRLADELGVDPSPELVALHQAILNHDPELTAAPVLLSAASRPRTNLPAPLTDLVGRAGAVRDVRDLLDASRLVTLTGPGGVGKTRLAVETATQLAGTCPDGVWLVELAGQRRPDGLGTVRSLAEVVTAVLGIRDDATWEPRAAATPSDPVDRLAEALRTRQLLLVLDNCEHLVEPVAELAVRLLHAAAGLRILATSREPLGPAGEVIWTVPPLELPAPGVDSATLRRSSAVALFVARAAASAPGFALTSDNAEAVGAICRRLDGIPLALELAATRVRALGVAELLARLDDRFRLLTSGHRGAPARQRTLRAMIDWSWQPLTEAERIVLRRLAVHAQSCTLEAAESVCAGEGVQAGEVLDLVARLVDRSLVTVIDVPAGTRYRLLDSVAAYCVERLREAGEFDRVRQRHVCCYLELAERAQPQLFGHDQRQWLERLDAEAANLRAALDEALRQRAADLAVRLVNALAWYWFLRGRLREARRSLSTALSIDGDVPAALSARAMTWQAGFAILIGDGIGLADQAAKVLALYDNIDDPRGRAWAQWFLSFSLIGSGELSAHEERAKDALAGFRALGDQWGIAAALSTLATQARPRGDLATVKHNGERSVALFRQLGDRWGQLKATDILSSLAEITGDYEHAAQLHRDGVRIAQDLGLWTELSYKLSGLGRIALLKGDYAQAQELHERARQLAVELSHRRGEQFAEVGLGLGARRAGKLDIAEAHLRNWLDWCRQVDGDLGAALILAELGFIAEQRGDPEAALALHLDGFAAARGTGDPRAIALALEGLAGAQALGGQHDLAAQLLGAAARIRESISAPLPPAERGDINRITAVIRAALGEESFAAHFLRGGKLEPDEACSLIVG